jgi:glycerate kinase
MRHYAGVLEDFWAISLTEQQGAGEGGGLGFALLGLGAKAYPASEFLLDWLHIESYWTDVDWVLTAQVVLDRDSHSLAGSLARKLEHSGRPLIVIAERLGEGYAEGYGQGIHGIYPLLDKPKSVKETERNRIYLLEQAAFRIAMWMRQMPSPQP